MSIFLFLSLGFAQEPCDANELSKVIETSTGDTAAEAFTSLASCEPSKALQFAMPRDRGDGVVAAADAE